MVVEKGTGDAGMPSWRLRAQRRDEADGVHVAADDGGDDDLVAGCRQALACGVLLLGAA